MTAIYTIIMNEDKSLTASVKTTIYQREKLVDKIQFLFPQKYEPTNLEIKSCIILLKYTDQGNVAHAIELKQDKELYKNHVRCEMDIDIDLTYFAGDIKAYIDFLKLNSDNGLYESVLTSGETIITVLPRADYFAYCADKSLDVINRKMLELHAKAEALEATAEVYDRNKADNIIYKDNEIGLLANGKPIGDTYVINSSSGVDENGVPIVEFGAKDNTPTDDKDDESYEVVEF